MGCDVRAGTAGGMLRGVGGGGLLLLATCTGKGAVRRRFCRPRIYGATTSSSVCQRTKHAASPTKTGATTLANQRTIGKARRRRHATRARTASTQKKCMSLVLQRTENGRPVG